ncbi:MAG: ABC transporter permease, partial [Methylobacteriaceae bacterium]|nr:ABC transporter permease [Methylobacteriaceae bacterium]
MHALLADPKIVCAGGFLLLLALVAILAPLVAPHDPLEQDL